MKRGARSEARGARIGRWLHAAAVDLCIFQFAVIILQFAISAALAQQGGVCWIDPATGQTVCRDANGAVHTCTQPSLEPSTYARNGVNIEFACAHGQTGDCGCAENWKQWKVWGDEVTKRIDAQTTRIDALEKGIKDQASQGYVEQRLKELGSVVDKRLATAHDDAAHLAASALAAAKDDASQLVPGILDAAKKDAEARIGKVAPAVLATLKADLDARLQDASVGTVASGMAKLGGEQLLLAGLAGAGGTLPVYVIFRALAALVAGIRNNNGNNNRGDGGPRPGGFRVVG